ncbi:MAG: META domain-containing protein [Acidimicrobiia bacterium]
MLTLSACATRSDSAASLDGDYQMTSGVADGESIPLQEDHPVTLTIDGDHVKGTAACNEYGGTIVVEGDHVTISDLATTEMACFPEESMVTGRKFLAALTSVDTFEPDEGSLTLIGPGIQLDLQRQPAIPTSGLNGTVWVLDSLVDGETVSSVTADRATLEMYTDGSMLGSTGCRTFHGGYSLDGSRVTISQFRAEGTCGAMSRDPLLAQDTQVAEVVGHDFDYRIEGKTLTLMSPGVWGLIYRAEG